MASTPLQTPSDSLAPGMSVLSWLGEPTIAAQATGLLLLGLAAYAADKLARKLLITTVDRVVARTTFKWDDTLHEYRVFERLAHLAPAVVVYYGVQVLTALPIAVTALVTRGATATILLIALLSAGAFLSAANAIYSASPTGRERPVKGYIQVVKILLYVLGGVAIVATLIGQSPFVFLGGIGAMTAVLLLVFRDTILSFVASLQMASYDLVRVGDWIEVPQFGADGDVIDIALHTVKVQNWDLTVTTIPTHKLIDGSFKNWRSMSESGGRRVKRAVHIDMNTIRFLDDADLARFAEFPLLGEYMRRKREELAGAEASSAGDAAERRLTNVGTFRAYMVQYLRHHPKIHERMTLMVRQRDPTPDGLPLEIYAFANDTDWVTYEGIQSDIFDHLLAIAPAFGLRAFQHPAGQDFAAAIAQRGEAVS
jgi:miniconductance mechanosensitive channel